MLRVETIIDIALKMPRTVKPRARSNKYAPAKPFRPVVTKRGAAIWDGIVVAVRTGRRDPDTYSHLCLRRRRECRKAKTANSGHHQSAESTHNKFTLKRSSFGRTYKFANALDHESDAASVRQRT